GRGRPGELSPTRIPRPLSHRGESMTDTPPRSIRVAVLGASGRMGAASCRAVEEAPDLELVARIGRDDALETPTEAGAEVAIDLTTPSATAQNVHWLVDHGITPSWAPPGGPTTPWARCAPGSRAPRAWGCWS